MTAAPKISNLSPTAGVCGGEVIITCSDFDTSNFRTCKAFFGRTPGRIVSASLNRVIVSVPDITNVEDRLAGLSLRVGEMESNVIPFKVGEKLADNLHPVANPAFDAETGNLYVTLSGTRGQKVPVSVWKISPSGEMSPFLSDIINPTGIAFDREGTMYVSSRYDSNVYRISPFKEAEVFARNLGIATGLAFDRQGQLYVGDRQGTIYRISELGDAQPFATLEPSVSAYHLAFGSDDFLYVTGPTASSFESVIHISPNGEVSRYFTGLGRPQGIAFDQDGNLYVAASLHGHRGIIRITSDKQAEMIVAGSSMVGLTFDDVGNMVVVTTREVYRVPMGIRGFQL
ncbi:MAG: gluconolaconase [Acidobacteriota bacterium]